MFVKKIGMFSEGNDAEILGVLEEMENKGSG